MAHAGELLSSEASKTSEICYAKYKKINGRSRNQQQKVSLLFLKFSRQAYHRQKPISAMGFFAADHSLIYFVCTNICTYSITISQFLKVVVRSNKNL